MSGLNGRISHLERQSKQSLDIPPLPDLGAMCAAYLARLDEIMNGLSPDTLEVVDEVIRELDLPLSNEEIRRYVDSWGIVYWHWRGKYAPLDHKYDCYQAPLVIPDEYTRPHLWILADIIRHGVCHLIDVSTLERRPVVDNWDKPITKKCYRYFLPGRLKEFRETIDAER